ncbi:uncharacterized protein EV422DRAFT_516195 [Fimicolochytrium jonesii]|uniref:uncharacterized protein n=1 Tax=Fimicolochytrium jonesii TaxID=1396493 RepID=UPI0022FED26E|nr:uncharacterized protein EV422DRAFT_516195 [Fimicolochytrium jonesii]KAI8824788.1 hypothetical protein EV422DRAFT_516195 [Fimicolochytrium jonesii]
MTPATLDPEPSTKNAPPDIKNESLTEIKVQSAQEPAFGQTSEPSHHKESIETEVKEAPPAPEPAVNIMQPSLEMPLTLDQTKATSTAEPKIEQNNSVSTPGCPDSPDEPKETSAPAAEMASGGPNGNEIEAARLPQKKNGTSPKRDAKPIYRAPGWKPRDGTMTRPITGNPKLLGRKASPPIAKLSESNEQETGPLSTKATDPHGDSTTGKKPEIIRTPSGLEIIRTRSASPRVEVSPLGDQALPPVVTITGFFEGHDGPAKKRKNKNRNGRGRGRGQGGVRDPPPATAPDIPIA